MDDRRDRKEPKTRTETKLNKRNKDQKYSSKHVRGVEKRMKK